jgi:ABC-type sugar transport system substrate-binding protein
VDSRLFNEKPIPTEWEAPAMIATGVREAVKLVEGAPVETKHIVVPSEIVTSENAANFYYPDSAY